MLSISKGSSSSCSSNSGSTHSGSARSSGASGLASSLRISFNSCDVRFGFFACSTIGSGSPRSSSSGPSSVSNVTSNPLSLSAASCLRSSSHCAGSCQPRSNNQHTPWPVFSVINSNDKPLNSVKPIANSANSTSTEPAKLNAGISNPLITLPSMPPDE